ncbi:hypothetical protein QUB52_28370 [Microcoleus sp. A6-C6]
MRNYQTVPLTLIGIFSGKANHIQSGSSIGLKWVAVGNFRGCDRLFTANHDKPERCDRTCDRGEHSVKAFLDLEPASM